MTSDIITLANAIANEKENIRLAITTAGVECPPETPLSEYAGKIATIPAQVEQAGTDIFTRGCDPTLTQESTSYIVPANYSIIDDGAFAGYENLQSVTMPNVYRVGNGAFSGCKKFSSLNAPYCRYVGTSAFVGTNVPKDYTNDTIERFGDGCFANNTNLNSISLTKATHLGNSCFYGCKKASSINIPNVKYIGSSCFENFGNARRDVETQELLTWDFNGPSVEEIGDSAFYNNTQLKDFSIPNVKRIGSHAFYKSDTTKKDGNLNLPNCEHIGNYAFNNYVWDTITVKDGCTIGEFAFYANNVNKLTKVIGKVGHVGSHGFYHNSGLREIDLSLCTYIGYNAFAHCGSLVVIDLSSCTKIDENGFYNSVSNEAKVWLPSTLVDVGSGNSSLNRQIYTDCPDEGSRPSSWSRIGSTGSNWHYGATHDDFLNA